MTQHLTILVGRKRYRAVSSVAAFYGVSRKLILRRIADESWNFPRPDKIWRGIRYWSESTLRRYDVAMRPVPEDEVKAFDEPWPPRGEVEVELDEAPSPIEPAAVAVKNADSTDDDGLEDLRRRLSGGPGSGGSEG
jgi:predicted DNA-binding transcriptional regulator AlpA